MGEGQQQVQRKQPPLTLTLSPCHAQGHGEREWFGAIENLATVAGVKVGTLEKLAAADAFRSLGLDRRQALWQVKALANAPPRNPRRQAAQPLSNLRSCRLR